MEIREILKSWNLGENLNIVEEDINYETERETHIWNINNKYILKMTDSEEEIKNNTYIAKVLFKASIPTQRVLATINGQDYLKIENKYYGVFTRIQGNVLKEYYEGDYNKSGFYLGKCLAKLHEGLEIITDELKENKIIFDNDMIEELNGWIKNEIENYLPSCKLDENKIKSFSIIREDFNNNFKELYYKLPRQVIHRDFQGENIIFQGESLVGYIDFDLSQINARLFDLCYLCTGALVKIFHKENERSKWLEFSKAVINGYSSENQITENEKSCIKYMMFAIELIMIAFFAKEGYSSIADINIEMINWIENNWEYEG